MINGDKNKRYLNRLYRLRIIGKGSKGSYFGKIDDLICFVTKTNNKKIYIGNDIDIKIIYTTKKCLFCELMIYDTKNTR